MPRLSDPGLIRVLLETDRAWAAYALADLDPGFFEHCEWRGCREPAPAIILPYRAFAIPVLVTAGTAPAIASLLQEIRDEPDMYLSVRPDVLPLIKARYDVSAEAPMWRMVLDPAAFAAPVDNATVPLTAADLPALQQLYADGLATGEAPDFFSPELVDVLPKTGDNMATRRRRSCAPFIHQCASGRTPWARITTSRTRNWPTAAVTGSSGPSRKCRSCG